MKKISAVLFSCCLAASANFAFAADGMSMEKGASGDAMMHKDSMPSHAMKKDTMDNGDKGMMKMEHKKKQTMTHRKSKRAMHQHKMEHKQQGDAMMRMQ